MATDTGTTGSVARLESATCRSRVASACEDPAVGSLLMGLDVDAILFDSGGVLIGPVGGRWNPRFDFEEIVLGWDPSISVEELERAIRHGDSFLMAASTTPTRQEYHEAMLLEIGRAPTPEILAALDCPLPHAEVVEPFDDVIATLQALRDRGLRMAVVSDAWPTLPELHEGVGIREYFEVYAISAVLGCTKPDPRMYRHASEGLGVDPARCLFIDDSPSLVQAAIDLGYQGRALLRDGTRDDRVPSIQQLDEVLGLISGTLA